MKCRVTVDIPDGEGWVEALGLGRDGPVQQFHTANVLRRIQKYMPYRTGATIKLTIAQTDTHVPEIVTDNPQARYLYYGMSKSGKSLNWDEAVMAAEGDAMAADLARYMRRMLK